jgi:hypothetical protein
MKLRQVIARPEEIQKLLTHPLQPGENKLHTGAKIYRESRDSNVWTICGNHSNGLDITNKALGHDFWETF